ncbi:MAG: alpha/beta hydrolase [Rubrivivax sp.]
MPKIVHPSPRPLHALRQGALVLVLASLLGGCAWLDTKQHEIALRPTPGKPAGFDETRAGWQARDERYTRPVRAPDGSTQQVALWWMPHADPAAPALLYLHGTFRSLYGNLSKIQALREAGFSVLAVDYRGWGDSTPIVPTEATIAEDAALAWGELRQRQPQAGRRVIFGHSMGSAVAVRLASTLRAGGDFGALILESAFTRMPDVAAEAGTFGRLAAALTTLQFDSASRIGRIDAPVLMLHGSADRTVPVQLGRRLRDAASPTRVRWVEIEGGSHSGLHLEAAAPYRQAMEELIRRLPPAPTSPATAPAAAAAPSPARTTPP